ncbi:MAG: CDP-diacylglycerol--glycerol-3-phosphate 3-phosphatidyltransferase [Alphaproteobacteria bacterium]|nr:CDP-diacylglycerol--glycerol-3-phosphate 3-phosphatidyltransferase [Alphaproteobacteria bacterium]
MKNIKKILNIPNILTLSRILVLPIFILGFYLKTQLGLLISLIIFVLCCITDYLDGYIAREYNQMTEFGKILDPLADKILISISILAILGFNMASNLILIPASITICRELIITSLRASGNNFKTSYIAKCKTATQMISIAIILLSNLVSSNEGIILGEILLWISSVIAIISCVKYFKTFFINK